jgi:probable rRNA maturation factor
VNIDFHTEDAELPVLNYESIKLLVQDMIESSLKSIGVINVIFCSDEYLLDINRHYLSHDYYTDIITFNYSSKQIISGDLFISCDTVTSNSYIFKVDATQEFYRVIFHGVLHLLGLDDQTAPQKEAMRTSEDFWLKKLDSSNAV